MNAGRQIGFGHIAHTYLQGWLWRCPDPWRAGRYGMSSAQIYASPGHKPSTSALLPTKNVAKNERRHDRGIGVDHEPGSIHVELAPGDLLVGHRTGIGTVGGGGVADLGEVGPKRRVFQLQVLDEHGHHTDGKIRGNPAADLEKTDPGSGLGLFLVPMGQFFHLLGAGTHGAMVFDPAAHDFRTQNVAERAVLEARGKDRQPLLLGGQHPRLLFGNLEPLADVGLVEQGVHVFVREFRLPLLGGLGPQRGNAMLDLTHDAFGNAGIRHPIESRVVELLFGFRGEIPILGHHLVFIVIEEIEQILFQIGGRAADGVDFVLTDHLGQGNAQLAGAHGSGHGEKHLAALGEQIVPGLGRVQGFAGVEVAKMGFHETRYGRHHDSLVYTGRACHRHPAPSVWPGDGGRNPSKTILSPWPEKVSISSLEATVQSRTGSPSQRSSPSAVLGRPRISYAMQWGLAGSADRKKREASRSGSDRPGKGQ